MIVVLHPVRLLLLAGLACGVAGCGRSLDGPRDQSGETVAEGVLFSVEYELGDGRTRGFTRLNTSEAVPGREGSWNVDAYGRLTRDHLLITYPQKTGLGPHAIPAHRLVDVQFGDGGIKAIDASKSGSKGL